MQKTYKDFYSDYFDEIKMDSLNYKDEVNGNFTTIEYYTIQKLWKEKNALKKAFFESYLINAVIKTPKDKKRNMPFALRFPAYYQESIEINLPDVWSIKNETEEINCTNFNFLYSYKNVGRKVILNYSYENIKDHVLPNETEDYVAALEKVNQAIGYELSSSTENKYATTLSGEGTNYSYLYALLGLCVVVTILIRNSRHKN